MHCTKYFGSRHQALGRPTRFRVEHKCTNEHAPVVQNEPEVQRRGGRGLCLMLADPGSAQEIPLFFSADVCGLAGFSVIATIDA